MKRLFIVLSLALISALVLGACAPTTDENGTVVPGATEALPGTGETPMGTEGAGEGELETPVATEGVVETPMATEGAAETPVATEGAGPVVEEALIYRLSNLIGADVVAGSADAAAEDVEEEVVYGAIDSFLVDPVTGQIHYVLLEPGAGLENAEQDLIAVPYSALDVAPRMGEDAGADANVDYFVTSLDAAALEGAPAVEDVDNIDFTLPDFDAEWRTYWEGAAVQVPAAAQNGVVRIADIAGAFNDPDVVNAEGEEIGDVADILVDPDQGMLTHLIVSTGGFLGLGENYTPIPWQSAQYDPEENHFIVNTTADDLQNAPSIESLDELDQFGEGWDQEYNDFWGAQSTTGETTEATVVPSE